MPDGGAAIDWVVLTMGTRPHELQAALDSIDSQDSARATVSALVIANGGDLTSDVSETDRLTLLQLPSNIGIPAGRDVGIRAATAPIVGSLDDDAVLEPDVSNKIVEAFAADRCLGAVSLRIVDENGETARCFIPRTGGRNADQGGPVTYFLGGAHALRREAYLDVGGYFGELWYGHEEVELSWRLIDAGWSISYLADAVAFHPDTPISRHADGWSLTGRNRVLIARRTLPWPVAFVHVMAWLVLGLVRAPGNCKRSYLMGWWSGWRQDVDRRPIRWATVWRLARLGRPPII